MMLVGLLSKLGRGLLLLRSCLLSSYHGRSVILIDVCSVVLNELLHVPMSPTSVEIILLHLAVNLIEVPVVIVESINRAHHSRAMAPTRTMYIELTGGWIASEF